MRAFAFVVTALNRLAFSAVLVTTLGCHPSDTSGRIAGSESGVRRVSVEKVELATIFEDTLPVCSSCVVSLRPRARIGSVTDTILPGEIPAVEVDGRGWIYATTLLGRNQGILRYDSTGTFHGLAGRVGPGPGEYRSVWSLFVADGRLLAGHESSLTWFDAGGSVERSIRLKSPNRAWSRRIMDVTGHGILINETRMVRSSDSEVPPVQLYGHDGMWIREYGPRTLLAETYAARGRKEQFNTLSGSRSFGRGQDGSIWMWTGEGGYRVENVAPDGRVRRLIAVRSPAEWEFPTFMRPEEKLAALKSVNASRPAPATPQAIDAPDRRPAVRPPTLLKHVFERPDGILITVLHVASPNWRDAVGVVDKSRGDADHVFLMPGYTQQLYDSVLDLIDLHTGALLARRRVSGTLFLTSNGSAYRPLVDTAGVISVDLFDIEVRITR